MQLVEEYLKRHKLSVPVIRHVQSGYAFFRHFDGRRMNWHVLSIEYDFDAKRPSQYVMQWMAPGQPPQESKAPSKRRSSGFNQVYHNNNDDDGGGDPALYEPNIPRMRPYAGGDMLHMEDRVVISWDEYEEFILKTAKKKWEIPTEAAILDGKEIFVTAWEMFVYAFERSFVPHMHQDDFYEALDLDRPVQDRHDSFKKVLMFLKKNDQNLWSNWVGTVEPMLRHYCFWLADVLRKK